MTPTRRQDRAGDRERQQKLRDRRKADGWRRITVWLNPEQAGRLETRGGDAWLGRTVKTLLGDALQERRPPRYRIPDRPRLPRYRIPARARRRS